MSVDHLFKEQKTDQLLSNKRTMEKKKRNAVRIVAVCRDLHPKQNSVVFNLLAILADSSGELGPPKVNRNTPQIPESKPRLCASSNKNKLRLKANIALNKPETIPVFLHM